VLIGYFQFGNNAIDDRFINIKLKHIFQYGIYFIVGRLFTEFVVDKDIDQIL
jgi:hypothetical protein